MISYTGLKCKEVIRMCDAETVGVVTDLLFDPCTARVTALCVTSLSQGKWFWKKRGCASISVPWDCIVRIGESCILVDLKL